MAQLAFLDRFTFIAGTFVAGESLRGVSVKFSAHSTRYSFGEDVLSTSKNSVFGGVEQREFPLVYVTDDVMEAVSQSLARLRRARYQQISR